MIKMQTLLGMIVPQLSKIVRYILSFCLVCLVFICGFSWSFVLPKMPETLEEARAFESEKNQIKIHGENCFLEQTNICQNKFLISNCVQQVEAKKRVFDRDYKLREKAASELIRLEKIHLKKIKKESEKNQFVGINRPLAFITSELPQQSLEDKSLNQAITEQHNSDSKKTVSEHSLPQEFQQMNQSTSSSFEKNQRKSDKSISEAQQLINQEIFKEKVIAAQKKRFENQKRMKETQLKREAYLKKQNEKYK